MIAPTQMWQRKALGVFAEGAAESWLLPFPKQFIWPTSRSRLAFFLFRKGSRREQGHRQDEWSQQTTDHVLWPGKRHCDTKVLMDGKDKHAGPLQSATPNLLKIVPHQNTSLLSILTALKTFSLKQSQKIWDHAVDLLPNFEFNRELFCFPKRNKLGLNIYKLSEGQRG